MSFSWHYPILILFASFLIVCVFLIIYFVFKAERDEHSLKEFNNPSRGNPLLEFEDTGETVEVIGVERTSFPFKNIYLIKDSRGQRQEKSLFDFQIQPASKRNALVGHNPALWKVVRPKVSSKVLESLGITPSAYNFFSGREFVQLFADIITDRSALDNRVKELQGDVDSAVEEKMRLLGEISEKLKKGGGKPD